MGSGITGMHELGVTHVEVLAPSGWEAGLINMESSLKALHQFKSFTETLPAYLNE